MAPTLRARKPQAAAAKAPAAASSSQPAFIQEMVVEYVIATRPWTFTASLVPLLLVNVLLRQPGKPQ